MFSGATCGFHRTWAKYADDILTNGFKDGAGGFVQLADLPLQTDEIKSGRGGGGDVSLCVVLPEEVLTQYEDKNTHYRRHGVKVFNVPAGVLNRYPVHLHETDYADMTRAEVTRTMNSMKGTGHRVTKHAEEQSVVLERALAFLDKYEGADDATLRHRLIEKTAYYGWATDPNADPHSDGQQYWLEAEGTVAKDIKAIGGVPFF